MCAEKKNKTSHFCLLERVSKLIAFGEYSRVERLRREQFAVRLIDDVAHRRKSLFELLLLLLLLL